MPSLRPTRGLLIVLVLAVGIFAPSAANGFAMDDVPLVAATHTDGTPDPIIAGWRQPLWYFGQRYWASVDNVSVLYRPVTILSYAVTYNAVSRLLPDGLEALPHHLLNILLHAAAVYLVWWLLLDLGATAAAAVGGALVFAAHAIHSEVVAGIVGRAELFSFGFGLLGTLLLGRGRPVLAGVALFLAFGSKESGLAWAPFVPLYLLALRWRGVPSRMPRARTVAVAGAVPLVVFFALRAYALRDLPGEMSFSYDQNPLFHVDALTRVLTAIKLWGYGLLKCLAPWRLYALYGPGVFTLATSPLDVGFLAALTVLGGWLVVGVLGARRRPLVFLSVAAFLGFGFLTSNVPFAIGTIFGERLYYMPSLALSFLVAAAADAIRPGGVRRVLTVVLSLWVGASCVVVLGRNGAWRDSTTLFVGDAARLPSSADLQAKAGYMVWSEDRDRALAYFERSVDIDPEFAGSWASRARVHEQRGELDLAERFYRRALETRYVAHSGVEDRTIEDLLQVMVARGRRAAAAEFAAGVLARKPAHYVARLTLLDATVPPLAPPRRLAMLEAGLVHHPQDIELRLRLGMALYDTGDRRPEVARQVVQNLQWSLGQMTPEQRRAARPLKARLYLADVLEERGDPRGAAATYRSVLGEAGLPADLRRDLEARLRRLER